MGFLACVLGVDFVAFVAYVAISPVGFFSWIEALYRAMQPIRHLPAGAFGALTAFFVFVVVDVPVILNFAVSAERAVALFAILVRYVLVVPIAP